MKRPASRTGLHPPRGTTPAGTSCSRHYNGAMPRQLAAYRQELENGRPSKARRERLEWQIREREKRLAEVEARLAGSESG